jgi:hypothetical protein
MMTRKVDVRRLRQSFEENQRGGDLWTPSEGVTLAYIHGLCRENDLHPLTEGKNHIDLHLHYNLGSGSERKMAVCLDPDLNPIIKHPVVESYLQRREIFIGDTCPVCDAILNGLIDLSVADVAVSKRYLWGITPRAFKVNSSSENWQEISPKPQVILTGMSLYEGFMQAFFDSGDITDLDSAIYVQIERTGKSRFDTKYKVGVCTQKETPGSVLNPVKFDDRSKRIINNAVKPDGDCDLFRVVSNLVKSKDDIENLISGSIIHPVALADVEDVVDF